MDEHAQRRRFLAGVAPPGLAQARASPAAPFAPVIPVAGAPHLRFTHVVPGTRIGMGAGELAFSRFGHQVERALRNPGPGKAAALGAATAGIATLGWAVNRLVGGRDSIESNERRA